MSAGLKNKTTFALSWSLAGQLVNQVFTFVISVVLARLLEPMEFGLVGMVMGITYVLQVIQDFGLGSAIIQKDKVDQDEFSSVFLFNAIIGFILSGLLFFSAELVADFYNEESLIIITRYSSVTLFFGALSGCISALLSRDLDFKKLTIVNIIATITSSTLAVVLAYYDFGVLSLVFRNILSSVLVTIPLFFLLPFRPKLLFDYKKIKGALFFGTNILGINVLARFFEQIDVLIIGRFYNPASVGFYNRAKTLKALPLLTVTSVLNKVFFPVFSSIKNDLQRIQKYFSFAIGILSFIYVPVMLLMVLLAEDIVIFLLTNKWSETIPYFQLLCLTGFFMPISSLSNNILISRGRASFSLKYIFVKRIIFMFILLFASFYGVFYFVLVTALYTLITGFTDLFYACNEIELLYSKQIKKVFYHVFYATISFCVVLLILNQIPNIHILRIAVGSFSFVVVFLLIGVKTKNEEMASALSFMNPIIFGLKNRLKVILYLK